MKLKHRLVSTVKFLRQHKVEVSVALSILAIGLSGFNTYLLQTKSPVLAGANTVQAEAPEKILKELPENVPFLGDPEAKLTIIEFGDFQCPYCGKFFNQTLPEIKKQYIDTGKVKFVYMDFAFLGPESNEAAEAA